jgi:hypothetical protein
MNKLAFILACMFIGRAYAQPIDGARKFDLSKKIFIEPLALIDGYGKSSVHIGVERPVVKGFCSVSGLVGLYPHQPAPYYSDYTRVGIKVYTSTLFKKSTSEQTKYVALHFFQKSQWYTVGDNIRDTKGNPSKEFISYDVRKKSFGLHLEIGTQFAYKHLCFEPFIGLGVRQSTVVNSASDSMQARLFHFNEDQATNVSNSNKYNAVLPSMSAGIRLSYLFKSKNKIPQKHEATGWAGRLMHYRKK